MNNKACKEKSDRRDDNSLRIFNSMKGSGKFFGDLSSDSVRNTINSNGPESSTRRVSDRLNIERMKALETLQKSQKSDIFKKPAPITNKENLNVGTNISSNNPTAAQFDNTDYVPFRRPNTINISDLVTDETINLESSSSCPPSAAKNLKLSFEPAEMTGRSTSVDKKDIRNTNQRSKPIKESNGDRPYQQSKHISVNDILASSFAPRARNLCETLQGDTTLDGSKDFLRGFSAVASTSVCSSFANFNGSKSLPRTADMSLSKNTDTEESFNYGAFSFSLNGAGIGTLDTEDFAAGELMQSKLISDEILWAQEYAAIPTTVLSKEAKAKAAYNPEVNYAVFDSSTSNSIIAGDPNFSIGKFFNMRSDNICDIVKTKSPVKCHPPVPVLVDEADNTITTSELEGSTEIPITPKIDNKTYTRIQMPSIQIDTKRSPIEKTSIGGGSSNRESKRLENPADTSYLLSISAIDRALSNLDMQSDVSGIGVSKQLLLQGRNAKSSLKPIFDVPNSSNNPRAKSLSPNNKKIGDEILKLNSEAEMISENKENLDPEKFRSSRGIILSDTISFNESLLNSSEMKQLQKSISQCRSPLSPIEVVAPNMRVHQFGEGAEADNDEWSTLLATRNKRSIRSKSPRDKSPVSSLNAISPSDAKTPVNSISSRSNAINKNKTVPESTSLSSNRMDSVTTSSNKDIDFSISPDISKRHSSLSSLVMRGNTLTVPQREEAVISPSRSDNSPFSSPRSYNQSKVSSPTPTGLGFQSPNNDTTNNSSDRQKLNAATKRKVVSSPAGSEASSTCSYSSAQTYRSGMSGVCGRNVSRCSNTSEFSHRDGKPIPLKVTNTELSWGSVKLRNDSRKSMQIKNISDKRLVIRIEVSGPGFQIVNSQRSNTVTLHSQECRSISINFCPTVRGVAIGKLSFFAPSGASTTGQSFLDVPLYGYGGTASVLTQNVCLAPMGLPFVTMGDVCELGQPLERTISFYNKGPLLGFASVSIDFVGLKLPRLSDAFEIHPKRILIPPKHVVDIRIVFRPKKEEVRKIIKKIESVSTVANMRVICGDEANRQRIRRLLAQVSQEERALLTSSSLENLWGTFPQETEMKDLDDMKENPNVAKELLSQFRIHEILLTINHDRMDDTVEASSIFLPDVDDTVLFRTICTTYSPTPSSNLGTVDEQLEEEVNNDDGRLVKITKHGSFSVFPKTIELSLRKKENVTLSVINRCKSRQFFEISCNLKDILHCSPSSGYIAAEGGQTEINVHVNYLDKPLDNVYVIVYMDNEKIEIPVKMKE